MGVPVVPADVEVATSLPQQQEGDPSALTAGAPSAAAGTLNDDEIVLHHVESVGRPHDWWWALNNRRKRLALAVFGPGICARVDSALTSKYWLLLTVTTTLFCVYAVDVCDLSAGSVEARTAVSGILLAFFILFSLDLLLSSIFVDKYLLSFFFWVDLVGTASLILDIQWFADGILQAEDSNSLQITRAGRAARIGSQMGRITRVIRMVRALRLLKVLQLRKRAKHGMDPHGAENGPIRPTVLGELLAESTTRKCVVIILFVLVVSTFLQTTPATASDYDRIQLVSYGIMTPQAFLQDAAHPVILMSYLDARDGRMVEFLPYTRSNMRGVMQLRTAVRCAKYVGAQVEACGFADDYSIIWYDVTQTTQLNAGLNLILTTVVIVCLGLSAYFFGRDATTYVIMPIETMLKYLKRMIMVGVDGDVESDHINYRKPPETDVLANYVSRLVNEIDNARWKAEEEARISDTLLNSMVPPRIARQLKELRWWEAGPEQRAQTIADSFPHATVLFTDIVGFTVLSSRISAEDAMRHLNNMYTIFDEIVEKYGLYKVETIGDSYMLVGGAPEERLDHAERVAAAALEIRGCVPLLQEISGEPGINVRIGMHSGAVTAGVVGFKNPRWHLFGDTCNTASRMESTGIAGEIQLSCTTYELIKEHFQCKVRGKIAVKGKGEMVTYLLERENGGADNPPDSPSGLAAAAGGVAQGPPGGSGGGADAMDREAFLASPQFKKAMERYTTARNSFLTEEEELCKLLKSLDEATVAAAVAAAGADGSERQPPPPPPSPLPDQAALASPSAGGGGGGGGTASTLTEAVAAAGVVVPRLAVGLGTGAFKQLVLVGATPSDLKALAIHMHEELTMARAMMAAAEEEKAAGIRRDMMLKLYARVLEAPGMSLRDTFAAILDTLYKVIECDVIKMYVVDHARGQLWPVTRHSSTDANRTLPLEGTLAGAAVMRARVVRVDDVAREEEFNSELEELPAGYTSKSMMCLPVFSVTNYHAHPSGQHARTYGATGSSHPGTHASATHGSAGSGGPGPGDVIAVLVMVNRWTPWKEAGAEEGERRIVPFGAADEACMRDAAASVGLLLMRRRGEMLLASAVPPSCLASASFSVAALPASVARQRLRTVARRSSLALLDTRGNLWAMKQEELMGQARDVLSALQRRVGHSSLSLLGCAGDEALVSYLVRIADEQGAGRFFNLAHSVGVLQGIYLTLRTHTELAAALGTQHLLALILAASLLNVDRDGELLPAVPTGAGALGSNVAPGGAAGRTSRTRAVGGVATAAAAGGLGLTPTLSRGQLQPPVPLSTASRQQLAPPGAGSMLRIRASAVGGSYRNSEPGTVAAEAVSPGQRAEANGTGTVAPPADDAGRASSPAAAATASKPLLSSGPASKRWSGPFPSGPPTPLPSPLPSPAPAAMPAADVDALPALAEVGAGGRAQEAVPPLAAANGGDDVGARVSQPAALPSVRCPDAPFSVLLSSSTSASASGASPLAAAVYMATPQGAGGAGTATSATGAGGNGGGGAAAAAYSVSRNRAVSARRGRLAAVVDDILSRETNMLSAMTQAEAAAVKATVVTLLALRNQPTTVLALPGLQPYRGGRPSAAPSGGAGCSMDDPDPAAVGRGGVFRSVSGVEAAIAVLAAAANDGTDGRAGVGIGSGNGSCMDDAGPSSPPPTLRSALADGRSSPVRLSKSAATGADATGAAATAGTDGTGRAPSSRGDGRAGDAAGEGDVGGGGSADSAPLSLAALIQAAESEPNQRLAEARTAVCALLLLTWSELLHCKDPGTALALLQGRATDVRNWASRLANVSGRRRSVSLLGPLDHAVDDAQSLLLLEVPRMQLEVIPLWQRTVELLPGLQPQLDAVQANRATYVSMLQDTASLTMAASQYGIAAGPAAGGGGGGAAGAWGAAGSAAAAAQRGAAVGTSAFWRPSLLRSGVALDGAPSGREPRRFISVKQRGSAALTRGVLAVMPSSDSNTSATAGGNGGGGGVACSRMFVRASSSRSYAGRNGPEDYDAGMPEPADAAAGDGRRGGFAASNLAGGARLARQGAAGAKAMRRTWSRGTGGPAARPARLASLALQSSGSALFVAANGASGSPGLAHDSDGAALGGGGSGQRTSGSNQSFVAQAQPSSSGAASGFRPRSQTHDLGTPPSAMAAAGTAAAPMSPSDASFGGHRRSSLTNRLNNFFYSFKASGRMAAHRPPHLNIADGASSYANAAANSLVIGAVSSPRPPTLFSGTSPFEQYGSLHGGAPDGAFTTQDSQQFSANLALALGAPPLLPPSSAGCGGGQPGGVLLSPANSQPLPGGGGGGGWSDPQLTLAPPPLLQVQLHHSPQSPEALSPVTSWRRPRGTSVSGATAAAAANSAGSNLATVGIGALSPAAAAMAPAAPRLSLGERGVSQPPKGRDKLRTRIMRRLSHVAARLPFHTAVVAAGGAAAGGGDAIAAAAAGGLAVGSGATDPASAPSLEEATAASARMLALDAAGVEISMRVSDGGVLMTATGQPRRRQSSTGISSQQQPFHMIPLPTVGPAPPLLRAGTIPAQQPEERHMLRQPRLSQPNDVLAAAARAGSPPPQGRRATAPSGALALAQQHEQYAAAVAAAAVAFAARQAEAGAGDGAVVNVHEDQGSGGGTSTGGEVGAGLGAPAAGSMLSLIGSGLTAGGALPTVAEFSGSGRNSSATGTARSNSTAAPAETPKHVTAVHPFGGSVAVAAATAAAAVTPHPFRFGQSSGPACHLTVEASLAVPPAQPPLSSVPLTPGAAVTLPPARFSTYNEATTTAGSSTSAASIVATASTAARGDGVGAAVALDTVEGRTAPHHHVSSKGVRLGLRLATDALRSMGRRGEGGYSSSNSGVVVLESVLPLPEGEMPRLSGAFAGAGAMRSGPHGAGAPPTAAAVAAGIASAGAGSSASGSRNPSRMQTPTASLRRSGAVPVSGGGVASLQAVIDLAEAALAGGSSGSAAPAVMSAPFSPTPTEYKGSVGGTLPSPSRNQSHRRGPAVSVAQGGTAGPGLGLGPNGGVAGMAAALAQSNAGVAPAWAAPEDAFNQRTSAPPAPSRFSLRRTPADRTFADQATAISAAPTAQPGQLPEQP